MSRYSLLHVTHTIIVFNTNCIVHCLLLIYFLIRKLYFFSYTFHYHCSFPKCYFLLLMLLENTFRRIPHTIHWYWSNASCMESKNHAEKRRILGLGAPSDVQVLPRVWYNRNNIVVRPVVRSCGNHITHDERAEHAGAWWSTGPYIRVKWCSESNYSEHFPSKKREAQFLNVYTITCRYTSFNNFAFKLFRYIAYNS